MHNVFTFHEAADVETFHPIDSEKPNDVLWIGNWGDEERTKELEEFLIRPAARVAKHTLRRIWRLLSHRRKDETPGSRY